MTPAERARAWFKRHAYATHAVPGGEVTGYHVAWSEAVEASLVALLSDEAEATLAEVNELMAANTGQISTSWQEPSNWTPSEAKEKPPEA